MWIGGCVLVFFISTRVATLGNRIDTAPERTQTLNQIHSLNQIHTLQSMIQMRMHGCAHPSPLIYLSLHTCVCRWSFRRRVFPMPVSPTSNTGLCFESDNPIRKFTRTFCCVGIATWPKLNCRASAIHAVLPRHKLQCLHVQNSSPTGWPNVHPRRLGEWW